MNKKVELLSPVGNLDSFNAACNAGADAVYMGLENFNARMMAENFSYEEYINCILKAHILNLKVYLTLNVLLFDNEIKEALNLIMELYKYGIDAVIVQDIGLAMLIHELLPDLSLHASTQMSVYSLEQVKFLKSIGFTRVVLARELTIEEIKYIKENIDIEIEVFVHGALCVSYSGQCLLSALIGNRSANRGSCAQPCRKKYTLINSKEKELVSSKYLLSKKDIYGLEYIKDLIDIGVDSLKIEGRGKTSQYVYIVTSKYRKYIDNISLKIDEEDKKELMQTFNRSGLCSGYLDGIKHEESISYNSPKNVGLYLGKVIVQRKEYVKIKLEEDVSLHDGIEIYDENVDTKVSTIVTGIKNDDFKDDNQKQSSGSYVWLGDISKKIKFGSKIYKTSSNELNEIARNNYIQINDNVKRKIDVNVYIKSNEKPRYEANIGNKKIVVENENLVEKSISKVLSKNDILENMDKNKEILFKFNLNNCDIENDVYVPVSILNKLRNELAMKLEEHFTSNNKTKDIECVLDKYSNYKSDILNTNYASLYLYEYNDKTNYCKLFNDKFKMDKLNRLYVNISLGYSNINKVKDIIDKYQNTDIYLYISNVIGKNQDKYIKENIEKLIQLGVKGFLLGSFSYLDILNDLKSKYDIKLVADYTLNVTNKYSAIFLNSHGFDAICLSKVLVENISDICKVSNVELNFDKTVAMTSRYCIISSFLRDKNNDKCSMPCLKDKYKLKDERNYTYDIYTDNIDCIMRLVRNIKNDNILPNKVNIRRTV